MIDPIDELTEVLRETLRANDLTLWSASGAHIFNSETALDGLARGLLARKVAEPSRVIGLNVERHQLADNLIDAVEAVLDPSLTRHADRRARALASLRIAYDDVMADAERE